VVLSGSPGQNFEPMTTPNERRGAHDKDPYGWAAVAVTQLLLACMAAAGQSLEAEAAVLLAAARRCRLWPL
jgi:hypothetical protein